MTPNKEINLNFPQMLELRYKINKHTTFAALNRIIDTDNFILLFVADKQHLIYLDVPQLLKLKEEITSFFQTSNPILA